MSERLKLYLERQNGNIAVVECLKKINSNEILVQKQDGQHAILYLKTSEMKNVSNNYLMTKEGRK